MMSSIEIQKELDGMGNLESAVFLQIFFKTGAGEYGESDCFRGIRVPALRNLAGKYRNLSLFETEKLLRSPFHEDRLLALFLLVQFFAKGDEAAKKTIYDLYLANTRFVNNWDLVDSSAAQIVGVYLRDKDRQPLEQLARSNDLWERRISMMATFDFIRKNDFANTLRIAEILLNDKEDLIHKAAGWMLREVGKRNAEKEREFLGVFYKKMPRTMLRYAIEKFPPAERQKHLKGEI